MDCGINNDTAPALNVEGLWNPPKISVLGTEIRTAPHPHTNQDVLCAVFNPVLHILIP
jgi:hypothetical protein